MNHVPPFLLFSLGPPSWMLPQTFQGELYHPTPIWSEPSSPDSWLNAWQAKLVQQYKIWRVVSSSWLVCLPQFGSFLSQSSQYWTSKCSILMGVKEKDLVQFKPLSPKLWLFQVWKCFNFDHQIHGISHIKGPGFRFHLGKMLRWYCVVVMKQGKNFFQEMSRRSRLTNYLSHQCWRENIVMENMCPNLTNIYAALEST